jgi:hypothetical protein
MKAGLIVADSFMRGAPTMMAHFEERSQKIRVFLAVCAVGTVSLLVPPLVAGAAARRVSLSPVLGRTSRAFHFGDPWRAVCDGDFCEVPSIIRLAFDTPSGQTQVDVDVALSLNFKVSRGGKIQVEAGYRRDGGRFVRFSPGAYPLTSPSRRLRTTTTIDWSAKGLQALGSRYVIEISVNPRRGRNDSNVHASGNRALLTVTETSLTG